MNGAIGRRAWAATGLLLVAMTLAFALGDDGWDRSVTRLEADASYYYVYLPSAVLDRDLDFSDEYRVTQNWYRFGPSATGRPGNVFGIGPAVFELPAFLVGHGLAVITGSRTDGFSRWETALCMWVSIPFTLGALLVAYRLARRRLGPGLHAYAGALLALVSGPVLYYAIRQPGYAHPFATLFAAWLVERWDASYDTPGPRSWTTWLVLGAAAGCATLARPQLATWGAIVLPLAVIDDLRRRGDTRWRTLALRWLAAAGVIVAIASPQLIAWKAVYGEWYLVPQGDGFMRWDSPAWSETLFSSRNGLFPWAPLYLPMLVCAALLVRRMPRLVGVLIVGLLAQAVVNGAAWDWWGGGSFGGRRFDSTYVVFALGAAAGLQWVFGAIRRFHEGARNWRIRSRFGAATVASIVIVLVALATIERAIDTSVTSAPIWGGRAAEVVWKRSGLRGRLAGWLSLASNAPARIAFAIRHGVELSAYDRVVGVHYLGETYPGLSGHLDRRTDKIDVGKPDVRHSGLRPDKGRARIDGHARLLVGLNRRGGVALRIPVEAASATTLIVRWNGDEQEFSVDGPSTIAVRAVPIQRGINVLELDTPGTLTIGAIELIAVDQL